MYFMCSQFLTFKINLFFSTVKHLCLFALQVQVVFVCSMFNFTPPQRKTTFLAFMSWSWSHDWDPSLRLKMSINFPFCGNHVEWRTRLFVIFFFFTVCPLHGPKAMREIRVCDWIMSNNFPFCGNHWMAQLVSMLSFFLLSESFPA
jgi:hypothetical protein